MDWKEYYPRKKLWATNIRYLNDRSEYLHAQEPIFELLLPKIVTSLKEKISNSDELKAFVDQKGGSEAFASRTARNLIHAAYRATGEEFYVVSFCGESSISHVAENGLLSQWRGYGSRGGFAIVFDCEALELLAEREFMEFDYEPSHFSDAIYGKEDEKFKTEFVAIVSDFVKLADKIMRESTFGEGRPTSAEEAAAREAVHWCATRYKHVGFKEENEVRIVAAPTIHNQEFIAFQKANGRSLKTPKQIKFRTLNGKPVPFIELFGNGDKQLPIKQIIVGPSEHKNMTSETIRRLVADKNIEVTVSDIPYV